jgi:hypothetical protein
VMDAVAAAAGGQRCIVTLIDGEGKRSKTEEDHEQDGEGSPHLAFMLHELWIGKPFGKAYGRQVSSLHLEFLIIRRRV